LNVTAKGHSIMIEWTRKLSHWFGTEPNELETKRDRECTKQEHTPSHKELENWVLAAQLSRIAYIRDDELHQIFLSNRDENKNCLQKPDDEGRKSAKDSKIFKYSEIYDTFCKFEPISAGRSHSDDEMFYSAEESLAGDSPPPSSDLSSELRLDSQSDSSRHRATSTSSRLPSDHDTSPVTSPVTSPHLQIANRSVLKSRFGSTRVRSRHGNSSITLPDDTTFYHFVRNAHSNTEVYIGNIDSKLFIAWRGTQLTAEDGVDMGDLKQDLKCLPGTVGWVRSEDSDEQITAHTGFIGQYNSVREDVWEIVNERLEKFSSTSEIFIAGHSMGGALTTLCTLDLSYNNYRLLKNNVTISSYPLASPRIGNQSFCNIFAKHVLQCDRIVLEHDVIPLIPPIYKHVGQEIRLKSKTCSALNMFRTHHYSTYLQTIVDYRRLVRARNEEKNINTTVDSIV